MKRIKVSSEGLSRIQSELRQLQGAVEMHQKQSFRNQRPFSECSSQATSSTTVKPRSHHRSPDREPKKTPRERVKSEMQNLANIILQQAHRIEKQQQELHCLKLHYERQVSTIKTNAEMLGKQLERLQSNVKKARAQQLCNHSKEILSAVEELQKCGLDLSKPQTIANHLLTKLLTCKTKSTKKG